MMGDIQSFAKIIKCKRKPIIIFISSSSFSKMKFDFSPRFQQSDGNKCAFDLIIKKVKPVRSLFLFLLLFLLSSYFIYFTEKLRSKYLRHTLLMAFIEGVVVVVVVEPCVRLIKSISVQ